MRRIYLIRHGRPDFPEQEKWCLGSTDLELGVLGHLQAYLLGTAMREASVDAVFCSPLARSVQTAAYLCENPVCLPGLKEQDFGAWDGLSFAHIRRRWPELYEARGRDRNLLPPKAEETETAKRRFVEAVGEAVSRSCGNIAIVAHQSVMGMFLCHVLGEDLRERHKYRFAYGSVTVLEYEETADLGCPLSGIGSSAHRKGPGAFCESAWKLQESISGKMRLCTVNQIQTPVLSEDICQGLLQEARLPDTVIGHCRLVAGQARELCRELSEAGYVLDESLAVCSGWLHDLARLHPDHAQMGAAWIRQLGYGRIAEIVEQHHHLMHPRILDEAAVVCLADCCADGDRRVSIRERFEKSRRKCRGEEAREAHQRRYEEAVWLKEQINKRCGKEVVI